MHSLVPITEIISRTGRGTRAPDHVDGPPADWPTVAAELRKGEAMLWLATLDRDGAPHVRPVFAAWTGSSFVVASNHETVKSGNLRADPRCAISTNLESLHVVVEGHAHHITAGEKLQSASRTMREVYDWPTEVEGQQLDAEYAAPTSGGPPFDVYEIRPDTAFGFPTGEEFEPTRWTFPPAGDSPAAT